MNAECALCDKTRNCINGKWCIPLHRYVNYDDKPRCYETGMV